jgi:hypothetical protein
MSSVSWGGAVPPWPPAPRLCQYLWIRPWLLRDTKLLTLEGDSAARFLLTTFPASDNKRSHRTVVAGVARYFIASLAIQWRREGLWRPGQESHIAPLPLLSPSPPFPSLPLPLSPSSPLIPPPFPPLLLPHPDPFPPLPPGLLPGVWGGAPS